MSTPFASVETAQAAGERHAALLLHAMAPADRTWMLGALPPAEREGLSAMLAELQALGIERDPALLAQATGAVAQTGDAGHRVHEAWLEAPLSDEAWLQRFGKDRVQALALHLRAEPAGLVAELLRTNDWPWRGALLQALEPVMRRRVETALEARSPGSATPPALRAALIGTLVRRLREPAPHAAPAQSVGRFSTWRQALGQWLGHRRLRLGENP